MEWYCYALLGIITALMSFFMDMTVAKLLNGERYHHVTQKWFVHNLHMQVGRLIVWALKHSSSGARSFKNRPDLRHSCLYHALLNHSPCLSLVLAHQWLYGCLKGHRLLQFLCWTLYPACLCALSTSFAHSICPFSAGQLDTHLYTVKNESISLHVINIIFHNYR